MLHKTRNTIALLLGAALVCLSLTVGCQGQNASNPSDDPSSVSSTVAAPHKFGLDDLTVNGSITLGMTADEVKQALGQPDSEGLFDHDEFIYGAYYSMTYGGLNLTFYDVEGGDNFTLGSVYSASADDIFACGLHVGLSDEDVMAAWERDGEKRPVYFSGVEEPCGYYLYGDFTSSDFMEKKPKDVVQYAYFNDYSVQMGYDEEYTIEYYYYPPLDWSENDTVYDSRCYSLVVYVESTTHLTTSIRLSYDAGF